MSTSSATRADLRWTGGERFEAASGGYAVAIDGSAAGALSPIQMLAMSLSGCMALDVVTILQKGRHALGALTVSFEGARAAEPPKKFEAIALRFTVDTDAPGAAVERAIQLSRDKYCSVWHSMRESIRLDVSYEITTSPRSA